MELKDIKIHDVVSVTKKHLDPSKSYYGGTSVGVVIMLSGNELVIKDKYGREEEIDLADSDYSFSFGEFSEIQFLSDIEKSVEEQRKNINELTEKRNSTIDWHRKFKNEISLFGKLARIFRKVD